MKKVVWICAVVCAVTVIEMIVSIIVAGKKNRQPEFVPPAFEASAQVGTPETEDPSWTQVHRDGMGFSAHICCKVTVKDGAADVCFTNDSGNEVWLKLRILAENDQILAETGLLKPNEYLKAVTFTTAPQSGAKIKLKIMAYEPETYYSAGAVTLNTVAE